MMAVGGWAKQQAATTVANVTVLHAAAWSEGDPTREGAAEFVVLVEIARLQQQPSRGGLIAVGDRRGLFSRGADEALRQAVLRGIPVVKLARVGEVLPAPHGLFIDGGNLSEEEARQVLGRCLTTYGMLPVVGASADGALAPQLLDQLQRFQTEFTLAAGTRLAAR